MGVRNDQIGLVYLYVIIEEDVDVYRAVSILTIGRLPCPAQFMLYLFRSLQHFAWGHPGVDANAGIEKLMFALEAPWCCLHKGRGALYRADTLPQEGDGRLEQLPTVAKIGTQGEIQTMLQG